MKLNRLNANENTEIIQLKNKQNRNNNTDTVIRRQRRAYLLQIEF